MADAPTPVDSATVVALRDTPGGIEVLMLRRHRKSGFAADAWVFPGGTVDPADRTLDARHRQDFDATGIAPRLGLPAEYVLSLCVAATRETFEEAGLLLARHRDGRAVDPTEASVAAKRARFASRESRDGEFASWLVEMDLVLDLGALVPFSRWITPKAQPRRYDTVFFAVRAPEGQAAVHDRVEMTDQRWIRPADALAAAEAGRMSMMPPTRRNLAAVAEHAEVDSFLAAAAALERIDPVLPHIQRLADGRVRVVEPGEAGYPGGGGPP